MKWPFKYSLGSCQLNEGERGKWTTVGEKERERESKRLPAVWSIGHFIFWLVFPCCAVRLSLPARAHVSLSWGMECESVRPPLAQTETDGPTPTGYMCLLSVRRLCQEVWTCTPQRGNALSQRLRGLLVQNLGLLFPWNWRWRVTAAIGGRGEESNGKVPGAPLGNREEFVSDTLGRQKHTLVKDKKNPQHASPAFPNLWCLIYPGFLAHVHYSPHNKTLPSKRCSSVECQLICPQATLQPSNRKHLCS